MTAAPRRCLSSGLSFPSAAKTTNSGRRPVTSGGPAPCPGSTTRGGVSDASSAYGSGVSLFGITVPRLLACPQLALEPAGPPGPCGFGV